MLTAWRFVTRRSLAMSALDGLREGVDHAPPLRDPNTMLRLLALAVLSLFASCSRQPTISIEGAPTSTTKEPAATNVTAKDASAKAPAAAAAMDDADCNLQTQLVPGIPGSPGHPIKSTRNPNGDSELAVLMRQFVDDLREVRTLVEAKQPVKKLLPVHRKMRCAWPTTPSERNEGFDTRAKVYLGAVRAFDEAPGQATYNAIIAACISCHAQSCGGPLDFIDSMKWQ